MLSTHTGSYALGIPDEFAYVARAIALNEYRFNLVAFPLESIMGSAITAEQTRIERDFIGAHSDIGGGFPDGNLAKVAQVVRSPGLHELLRDQRRRSSERVLPIRRQPCVRRFALGGGVEHE